MKRLCIYKLAIFALFVGLFISCEDGFEAFQGSGPTVTLERPVTAFKKIVLNDNVNLIIDLDTAFAMWVTAPENWMDEVTTEVNDSTLTIGNKLKSLWLRDPDKKITVNIRAPHLYGLKYNGTGNVDSYHRIYADNFTLEVIDGAGSIHLYFATTNLYLKTLNGVVDVTAEGHTQNLYIYNDAVSPFHCENLFCNNTQVISKGTNNCYVMAYHKLDVNIQGKGNVFYWGDPDTIVSSVTGEGRLIQYFR